MNKKTATFKKTEANSVCDFLNECIEHGILTVKKAQAIYKAVRDVTVDAMVVEVYPSGTIFVQRYRSSRTTGETIMHQGYMYKQSTKIQFEMVY